MRRVVETDGERLVGEVRLPGSKSAPQCYFLHGAGPAGKERTNYIAEFLLRRNIGSCAFDFSGHGESTGALKQSSIVRRIRQAMGIIESIGFERPLLLIGTSMGGHVALELLPRLNPEKLILFCPALYGAEAIDKQFDERFSEAIRTPHSFEGAPAVQNLSEFRGEALMFLGSEDTVIPKRVSEIYRSALPAGRSEFIELSGAGHVIHKWAVGDDARANLILNAIERFIR